MRTLFPLAFLICSTALAQNIDYFPLQTGNQWVYRGSGAGAGSRLMEVGGSKTVAEKAYFQVSGLMDSPQWLRRTAENRIVRLNPSTGAEDVVFDFSLARGSGFDTALGACSAHAMVESSAAPYSGPIGTFSSEALAITYTGFCADAGITRDVFLPWIGLAQRTETSFAGPRTYDLVYTRVGTALEAFAPLTAFSLSVDRQKFAAGEAVSGRLRLRSTQSAPVSLEFASGQEFDVTVEDASGTVVYRWSAGRLFIAQVHTVNVDGEKNWLFEAPLPSTLKSGRYTLRGWLTSDGPAKQYAAAVGIEITN